MPVLLHKADPDDALHVLADKLAPRIRKAFLAALNRLKGQISLDDLAEAVKTGDVDKVLSMLAIDQRFTDALNGKDADANIDSFSAAITSTFVEGAVTASDELVPKFGFKLSFDLANPEATKFLDSYTFATIKDISANTREGIRSVITNAFDSGGSPYEQARLIKSFIGLTDHQSRAVLNYRKALSSHNTLRQALQRSLRDGRFDSSIQRAIRTNIGLSQTHIDQMTERYEERFIQYRATTIARSESLRASNKGQRALWKQAQSKGLLGTKVKRVWIVSGDADTCEDCMDLDGTVVGLDEEFAPGIDDPGDVHPDDRCSQGLVFK
jgi:Phage Mu protein F like protein